MRKCLISYKWVTTTVGVPKHYVGTLRIDYCSLKVSRFNFFYLEHSLNVGNGKKLIASQLFCRKFHQNLGNLAAE